MNKQGSLFFIVTFLFLTLNTYSQEFNKSLNKDSLLRAILEDLPESKRAELLKIYKNGDEQPKELVLMLFSEPWSSKKKMIANIDSNFDKISQLKTEYLKLVPKGYIVFIEFNPANIVSLTKESIDLKITRDTGLQADIQRDWHLEYNSKKLSEMLKPLNWTSATLQKIRELLNGAKCVSISNDHITTIGFARSGMGKYSFKLFDHDLTAEQIKGFNDGCTYIFYKKNIVLEYGGGAVGAQCFPD